MNQSSLKAILDAYKHGRLEMQQALEVLKDLPFQDLGFAKIDHHRCLRNGFPEMIYGEGKTPDQIQEIIQVLLEKKSNILVTRLSPEKYQAMVPCWDGSAYHPMARVLTIYSHELPKTRGMILVTAAGTSDIGVAEEAALTAEMLGNTVERLYDVGVAGIHRLLAHRDLLEKANIIIAAAGMEGALPSIIGGLVDKPVLAVPTSIGYGASFNGLSALLAMLNSCASGIAVFNIDNGFGAGCFASRLNQQIEKALEFHR